MTIDEVIKRFEQQEVAAQAVLDSGFGTLPGESNRLYLERREMAAWALKALRELKARPPAEEMVALVQELTLHTYESNLDFSVLWCNYEEGPCTAGGEFDCRDEWIEGCIRKWLEKPSEERWEQVRGLFRKENKK